MDQEQFDRLVRMLGTGSSRRAAIAAIAAALPLGAAARSGRTRPRPEGPCGDGSARVNRCTKHADCCTGYCKEGKCRGVELGGKCSATRKCRGASVCVDGRCERKNGPGPGPGPGPASCTPQNCPNGCCDGTTCVPWASQATGQCGTAGAACAACTDNKVCVEGACRACDPYFCAYGCCDRDLDTCIAWASQSSGQCGTAGAFCVACPNSSDGCAEGICAPCNAGNCPTGCCDGDTCVPVASQSLGKCGNLGNACVACSQYSACNNGICDPVPCNSTTCAQGCCNQDGNCIPWAQQYLGECGTNGGSCFACNGFPTPTACTQGVCTV